MTSGFVRNPNHLEAIRQLCAQRVVVAADKVTDRVKLLLNEPGIGEHYRGNPRASSVPGDPPTSQTGELAASQTTRGPVIKPTDVVAASGSDEIKAFWLQVGTVFIAPRPYMLRALLESWAQVLASFVGPPPESNPEGSAA